MQLDTATKLDLSSNAARTALIREAGDKCLQVARNAMIQHPGIEHISAVSVLANRLLTKSEIKTLPTETTTKKASLAPVVLTDNLAQEIISETKKTAFRNAIYGQQEAGWLSFYDVMSKIGLDVSGLEGLMQVAQNSGWWWPLNGMAILTERYSQIHRDEKGRLHNEAGPAILYPDGWAVYVIDGVRVNEQIVMHPETLTDADINNELNTEVRRIMTQRRATAQSLNP